jgi:hypothetical protein
MNEFDPKPSRPSRFTARLKAYFGFAEPGLAWRQRCAIFMENERRSWARLLGSRRPEDACISSLPPAKD